MSNTYYVSTTAKGDDSEMEVIADSVSINQGALSFYVGKDLTVAYAPGAWTLFESGEADE